MGRKTDEKLELLLPTHLVAHLYFFATQSPTLKKSKRATKPTHQDTANMDRQHFDRRESTTGNTGLAKVAVQYSADTFVVNQNLVLRINICCENRHLRQARKR
jgi:hypothetical protein